MNLLLKYLITSAVIVLVSETAKRSDRLGALIASLPLITIMTLIWLHIEKQPIEKIGAHAYYTFWYVVPTMPMFLLFPFMLPRYGFGITLLACIVLTALLFYFFGLVMQKFGINLL